ncbi:MAG: NAD(P)H-dependent flavin oxidoreductase [Rickettsiales endosymbiont of Dermacentor nuttalli]
MSKLQTLWKKGTDFLGSKYAILGGAMSWISENNLVSAISNAGGFGIIACGSMTPKLLEQEIKATQAKTSAPFGVNLITMHPDLDALVDVCVTCKISHVVLAGGLSKLSTITKLKAHNIKVMCFAPALVIAKKLIKSGVDAIIIEGMEAGGHIGPVSTSVLVQEILPNVSEVPIFVAGGIARGEAIANFLRMGAAGCQLGTRFVCTHESIAHPNFKKIFIQSHARDAVVSVQVSEEFPIIPVRAIANNATKDFINIQHETITLYKNGSLSKEEAQLKIEHFWAGALRKAIIDGDTNYGSVMAGQSVGMVTKEQSVQDIIEELVQQANNAIS